MIYSSKHHQHFPAGTVSQGKGVTTQNSEGDQEGVELGEKLPPLLRAKDPCHPNRRADWICIPRCCWTHPANVISTGGGGGGCSSEPDLLGAPHRGVWQCTAEPGGEQLSLSLPKGKNHPKRRGQACSLHLAPQALHPCWCRLMGQKGHSSELGHRTGHQ